MGRWLARIKTQTTLLGRTGAAFEVPNLRLARKLHRRLLRNAEVANRTVATFGFRHCLFHGWQLG